MGASQPADLVTFSEFIRIFDCSPAKGRRLIWSGAVPHFRIGRSIKVSRADICRILQASRVPAKPEKALPGAISEEDVQQVLEGFSITHCKARSSRRGRN